MIIATAALLAHDKIHVAFSEILRPAFEIIEHNKNVNITLSKMRDALLPKLISGELRVSTYPPTPVEGTSSGWSLCGCADRKS